jgi:hypothetical protein
VQQALTLSPSPWFPVRDGDRRLRPIYNRHYSSRGNTAPKITGPGSYVILLTHDLTALFAWRKFEDACALAGDLNCAVFRREPGAPRASDLILAAEPFALAKWGPCRAYTYVDSASVSSPNPGWCFQCAGYRKAGVTAGGHGRPQLLVLEKAIAHRPER